jgi:V/A-type H+-transporting ATPase subunit A
MKGELDALYYDGWVDNVKHLQARYREGQRIGDQMKVVGEEDLTTEEFGNFLKAEFLDFVFLQQNAFSDIDAGPDIARVARLMKLTRRVIDHDFGFTSKNQAREVLTRIQQRLRDWNLTAEGAPEYESLLAQVEAELARKAQVSERQAAE